MITLVQQYFSESARRFPKKVAVSCDTESDTFSNIDQFSDSLAHRFKESGVKRGQFVPFFMAKSVNSIKAILGILKSDCAYVPIDIKSPANRLNAILETIDSNIILVDNLGRDLINKYIAAQALQPLGSIEVFNIEQFAPFECPPVVYKNLSIDIAYVLFTSGSTGTPKGVMIPHKAIIDYIEWCVETYTLTGEDVIANHAPLYFDNSTFDLYTAFKVGASLHLVHEELNTVLPRIIKWLQQREVSTFFCVPSVLTLLAKSRRLKPDSFPHLRHVICAGEVLPPKTLRQWMQLYPHIQFTNMYGPTEITVDCTYHIITDMPAEDQLAIPIGKARNNMELFVREDNGNLSQTPGAKGELLVRGTSVAYGYLGDSVRTAASFIQNPQHSLYPDPLYTTGDLVEIDAAGEMLFLGRIDNQIKYLGHRIELGEIESVLATLDSVAECVVVFDAEAPEIGALVALETGASVDNFNNTLTAVLPGYMIPTRIVEHAGDFPRTANGKYDRKATHKLVFGTS
ncbi:amino acid adenylation domain-containing protein [Exilibacterium tricleocarpae]|uniref:Amino acid adenylation domain-containing protein n=1 Tax=Exilibacterium tricleocarpae TaxID=2591008 RepID=A0A545T3H6_9GAMM|nr:amino acid adenylation domain-containing protein [Exilibacterium tricleocarpae]TQV71773.1 amino acid adenylation domain-containing protein [Exilibacterium tricleocarpae]